VLNITLGEHPIPDSVRRFHQKWRIEMKVSHFSIARRTGWPLILTALILQLPWSLSAQEHTADHGSTELADHALSLYTNYSEEIFAGMPDQVRLNYIKNLEREYQLLNSDSERGEKLLSLAGKLLTNKFPQQAQRLYRRLAEDPAITPQTRAEAWIKAGHMAPVYGPVDDSVNCFRKSVEIMESIPESDRTWTDSHLLLKGLSWQANNLYCSNMDSAELPALYRRILAYEPEFGRTDVNLFLTMGLDASRLMRDRNDPEAAVYLRLAEKYVDKDSSLSLRARLSILMEISGGLYTWNDPARIRKLRTLWDDGKHKQLPQVMRIGNEIMWAMFLERDSDREAFEAFAEEFYNRGKGLLKTPGITDADDVSLYASQGAAALAVSKHETGNEAAVRGLKVEFQKLRGQEPVIGRFPGHTTREQLRTMADAFYMATTNLFQINLQKAPTGAGR
jgi:hypothetical protein